jgi:hypothetical protein
MSYPGTWPTADDLKKLVDVDPTSTEFDDIIDKQIASAIALVKDQVGQWDELIDAPDDQLWSAALRAGYLLSLKESPTAIVGDQVFMTLMSGHHRRFAIA